MGPLARATGAAVLGLVVLVVNRMPCAELEGFEGGSWPSEGWVPAAEAGGTISAGAAHDGRSGSTDVPWHYRLDRSLTLGSRLGAWVRSDHEGGGRFYLGFDAGAEGCKSFVLAFNTGDIRFHENPHYGYRELPAVSVSLESGRWYFIEVELMEGGSAVGRLFDQDGTTLVATVHQTFEGGVGQGGLAFRSFGGVSADTITFCP